MNNPKNRKEKADNVEKKLANPAHIKTMTQMMLATNPPGQAAQTKQNALNAWHMAFNHAPTKTETYG